MNTLTLKHNNKNHVIAFPENWNELTKAQLLYIANFWQAWQLMYQGKVSMLKAKAALFIVLMGNTTMFNLRLRIGIINKLSDDEKYSLLQLTDFIFQQNNLTKNPFPAIRTWYLTKLYAPNDCLGNITAGELHFADLFYLRYTKSNNIADLNLLIGTLYRPKKAHQRTAFNKDKIEAYAAAIAHLHPNKKQCILLWYIGCRDFMFKNYPEIFSGENQHDANTDGWLPIIMELSGGKFGTFEQTQQTEASLLFLELKQMQQKSKPTA